MPNTYKEEANFRLTTLGKAEEVGMLDEYEKSMRDKENGKDTYELKKRYYEKARVKTDEAKEAYENTDGLLHPFKKARARRKLKLAKSNEKIAKREKRTAKEIMKMLIEKFKSLVRYIKGLYKERRRNRKERIKKEKAFQNAQEQPKKPNKFIKELQEKAKERNETRGKEEHGDNQHENEKNRQKKEREFADD